MNAKKELSRAGQSSHARKPELPLGTHLDGVACGSVFGPPNLESVAAIHREAPNIPPDPPGNGPDVTQIKNFRQHKSRIFLQRRAHRIDGNKETTRPFSAANSAEIKKDSQEPLALRKTCDRLPPVCGLERSRFQTLDDRISRSGRQFNLGGQGTWA